MDKDEIDKKVTEAARILDLEPHLDRKPSQLSGGQRQRVAMGRAIVREPAVFLMDEPLSNLDAKLRVQMRTEVSRIQQRLGTTTVYVTHDQTEAMTLGDRVAVMRAGVIQQVGSPMELYNEPVNLFVAGFVGSPAMNFMPATVEGDTVKLPFGDVRLPSELHEPCATSGQAADRGHPARALRGRRARGRRARPRHHLHGEDRGAWSRWAPSSTPTSASPRTRRSSPQELRELAEDAGGGEVPMAGEEGRIVARLDPASEVSAGQEAELLVDATRLQLFDPEDGRNLTVEQRAARPPRRARAGASSGPATCRARSRGARREPRGAHQRVRG